VESQSVDLSNVYSRNEGERPKWQQLPMKLRFLHLAMATYKYRFLKDSEEDDDEVFEMYRSHMSSRAFSNIGPGNTGDVP
jgi:hypothetical protein